MEFAPEMLDYANLISSKGLTGFTQGSIQKRRDGYSAIGELLGEGPLMREIQDISIPSKSGNIFIKNYIPKTDPKSKILYFHGGGWVVGRLKDFDPFARKLAEITSSIVSLVDYRLAPEFPFPLPLEDAYTSLEWISSQNENIWKDLPLVIAGDSAGGNLAASTILKAKETSGPKIDLQILIYPVTEAICDTDSYKEFELGPGLTKKDMEWFIDQYLPNHHTRSDPKASPLYQTDWKELPPAIVFIADIDPLRDDGKLYAEKLKEAGVSVLFKEFKGYTHGFFTKVNLLKAPEEGLRMISEEMDRIFKRKEVYL
ncbi:alpha/beta hydrolase [Leptospira andrefontaineae]|uniref:Alpha/beta hydrolase n=1 Tax=Leptospira andrefontaineae TaxID=2484976 RepID=A0A4R9HAM2_9LEPT|nr:alpha/beta hydrolase [Leptospira andrefontaineae]TGK43521.1 alpha/beta hydrolase [Leptospira andrefontaineae]